MLLYGMRSKYYSVDYTVTLSMIEFLSSLANNYYHYIHNSTFIKIPYGGFSQTRSF